MDYELGSVFLILLENIYCAHNFEKKIQFTNQHQQKCGSGTQTFMVWSPPNHQFYTAMVVFEPSVVVGAIVVGPPVVVEPILHWIENIKLVKNVISK